MLGFASCTTDTDPKLIIPEVGSFVLNEPVFADQELVLAEGQTFELVASQPDYGFSAKCVYGVRVAIDERFSNWVELTPEEPGLARMTFKDEDLAKALCKLYGFDESTYEDLPAGEVFFRATVMIPGVDKSSMMSNVVSMKKVKFYHAVQGQRSIYLVGSVSGWTAPEESAAAHYASWALTETEIGSDVYIGSFHFPAGEAEFRFYTELSGWGNDGERPSIGANPDDGNALTVTLTNNVYEGPCVEGKGSWKVNIPTEGNVNLTVDLSNMTVKFEVGGDVNYDIYPCVYIVGNVEGWKGPEEGNAEHYAAWKLYDTTGSGIYTNKPGEPFAYSLSEAPMFRIYTALTGWDGGDSVGSQVEDNPMDVTVTDGVFEGEAVKGKGNWRFTNAPTAGTFEMQYDSNAMTVKVTFAAN